MIPQSGLIFRFLFWLCFINTVAAQKIQYIITDTVWLSPRYDQDISNNGEACYVLITKELEPALDKSPGSTQGNKIQGMISYEYLYRSRVDTPFQQNDLQQHIIRANFKTKVFSNYPLNVNLAFHGSNSPYFKNYMDVNVGFDPQSYRKNLETKVMNKARQKMDEQYGFSELEKKYKNKIDEARSLSNKFYNPQLSSLKKKAMEVIIARLTQRLMRCDSTQKAEKIRSITQRYIKGDINSKEINGYIKKTANLSEDTIKNIIDQDSSVLAKKTKSLLTMLSEDSLKSILSRDSVFQAEKIKTILLDYVQGNKKPTEINGYIRKLTKLSEDTIKSILNREKDSIVVWQKFNQKAEKISKEIKELSDSLQDIKQKITDSVNAVKNKMALVRNSKDLDKLNEETGLAKDSLSKLQRMLLSVRSFSIGRSMIDYSELTVRNVSITGLSAAVSPGPYISVAAGYIDYRFRDFVFKDAKMPRQSALMGRVGLSGYPDRGIFLTAYTGKREILYTGNGGNQYFNLSGFSLQYIWPVDKQNIFSVEIAKSNTPAFRSNISGSSKQSGGLMDFGSRTNEAYCFQYKGIINLTKTSLKAMYKRFGSDFQSFSMYSYNANQTSYAAEIDQALWKRTIDIKLGIRKNEFVYPYLTSLSSNSVFKTAQLTFRKRKWPTVSAGYYPSTQIVVMPDKEAAEITYHTLSFSASYQYRLLGLSHSSMLLYSRFYNSSSDSGFLYYKASYWGYQHFVWLGAFTIQSGYTNTKQNAFAVKSIEGSVSWMHPKGVTLSGGIKWNTITGQQELLGANCRVMIPIKKIGNIQLSYDRSCLPAWQQKKLLPVDTGRLIYTKNI